MAARTPKSKAETKPKSKRGGARKNSGRKPKPANEIRKEIVAAEGGDLDVMAALDEALKAVAPRCVANLVKLANGGLVEVEETLEPAGTVTVKVLVLDKAGEPVLDFNGKPVLAEQLLYPDLPPGQLVVTSRKTGTLHADRQANQYLLDRVMGKPRQAVELTGKDGGAIPIEIYLPDNGRDRRDPEIDPPPA